MDSEDWERKGLLLFTQNRVDEALDAYNKAIQTNPHSYLAWSLKCDILVLSQKI